jgi:hypothetical protein
VSLFAKLKSDIVSSPLLAHYHSSKPCFLKTDWAANAFGFILMLPNDSPESISATALTGYASPYPRGFCGCLVGCGNTNHQYKDCAKNRTKPTHSTFTKHFLARYPEKRKYPLQPEEVTTLVTIPPPATPAAAIAPGPSIL